MDSYNFTNVGVPWDSIAKNVKLDTIIDYEQHNGRINIIEEPDPEIRFKMSEKIARKNRASEYCDAVSGIEETSILAKAFFSEQNIQIIQNGLRAGVYNVSKGSIIIPPQNVDNLKIIMRSTYLQYSKHYEDIEKLRNEILKLNQLVLDYSVENVFKEAQGYFNYCKDQSTLVIPMERPTQIDKDFKHLEIKTFV